MPRISRTSALAVLGLGALALASAAGWVAWHAARAIRLSQEELGAQREGRVTVRSLAPLPQTLFQPVGAPAVFARAARFQDHFYIAGSAGLFEYDLRGTPLRQFLAGRDLPSSPLVALATTALGGSGDLPDAPGAGEQLVLATAEDGLLSFDGQAFRQIYPERAEDRAITTLLAVRAGRLLVGTRKRGVLLYDGRTLTVLHPSLADLHVTALAGQDSDLWVGTLDHGVLHFTGGRTETFGEDQGLPDRQVQSIATGAGQTYVGTVLGVAVFDGGRFSRVVARDVLVTALFAAREGLVVGSEDQGVIAVPIDSGRAPTTRVSAVSEVRQILGSGDELYVLTRNALFRTSFAGRGWQPVLEPGPAVLSDRNISALAADPGGRLWVGYFDRGLDLLAADAQRAWHTENEHVFCVNRIVMDDETETVAVATANGLVRFDRSGRQHEVLTRSDGLVADHVTDVARYRGGLVLATPAGLTFLDSAGARSMYAFHGLVNNHVHALGVRGDDLMVGTIGGLSELASETVRANYTAGTAKGLGHNWITAVVRVSDQWMIGTYGAGVLALDDSGRFHSFEGATGPLEINPNAMLVTPRHVFAGSLGRGLYVYDRDLARWTVLTRGLPSSNVTALAASGGVVYVGTDNGLVRFEEQKLVP